MMDVSSTGQSSDLGSPRPCLGLISLLHDPLGIKLDLEKYTIFLI